jgi:demethylmenaquinone methyltransferase/2-methoxy-6-polyprenyl-1,4-benzoquinol methylase
MTDSSDSKKIIDEMNRYYDARAPWHDHYMSYTSNEAHEELLAPIISVFEDMVIGANVLEIACGTGNWTQVLAKRANSVVATDISPKALAIAESKLTGYDNVSLIESDAYELANIEGTFDVAFSADWWSHIPKQSYPLFLEALLGKLRPGSTVIFIDMSMIDYFRQEPCLIDADGNRVSLRKLPDGSEFRVIKNFPDEAELRQVLGNFGKEITYYDFPELVRWMVIFQKA